MTKRRNSVLISILLIFSMVVVAPTSGQEDPQSPPITLENADRLVKLAIFRCLGDSYPPSEYSRSRLLFSPDSRELGFLGGTGGFCFWDVSKEVEIRYELSSQLFPYAFAFTDRGHLVFAGTSFDHFKIYVVNLDAGGIDWQTSTCKENNNILGPNQELLAIGGQNCDIEIWRWQQNEKITTLKLDHSKCGVGGIASCYSSAIGFNASGDRLVTSWNHYSTFSFIALWDTETGANLATIKEATNAALSPDGNQLVVSGSAGTHLLNTHTGQEIVLVDEPFEHLAFSPDGHLIAARDRNGIVHLLDAENLTEFFTLAHPIALHSPLVFNSNSQMFATIAADSHALQLWDVTTGNKLFSLDFPLFRAINVTFSPDGRLLAVAFDDGSISLWCISSPFSD